MVDNNNQNKPVPVHSGGRIPAIIPVILLLTVMLSANTPSCYGQHTVAYDSSLKLHSPTKAALFSAALPGLGQAYNKKYWKIPIVYAGFGVFTYFIIKNRKEYVKYREAFNYVSRGDSTYIDNEYVFKYNEDQLRDGKNYYRRNLEFTYILTGLWYIINILDATVDAHFFDFDVSDDLSLRIDPIIDNCNFIPGRGTGTINGLTITLKF